MTTWVTQRVLASCAVLLLAGVVLACGGSATLTASTSPRWACPSPLPKPYGSSGPIKRQWQQCDTDPVTGVRSCETKTEYYEVWEQEYANLGGPPFPSPTPYGFNGKNFAFGQRVEVAPLHALVTATAGPRISAEGTPDNSQLYHIAITWTNPTAEALPIQYDAQVRLRAVTTPDGRVRTDSGWGITAQALEAAHGTTLPSRIPTGESSVMLPIIAPAGTPKIVEINFPLRGIPSVGSTPTPNTDLQRTDTQYLTVQWTNSGFDYYGAPACGDAGALTDWGSGPKPAAPVSAPAGADRLVQIALGQVGKSYVWGAKGPETFDCSGLATWSYAQIGISIPQGTAGQWPQMKPVGQAALKPGDLVFFAIEGGSVDHVGILAGDLNGDGKWDMVHAASPKLGVRIDYDIFNSRYYQARIRGFRTAR